MAERIVIDASIAIAYLREEVRSREVERALGAWLRDSAELNVPALFWVEVLNVLVRRHGWDAAAVVEVIDHAR